MWGPSVIVVPTNSPYQSFDQLLADAKKRPDAITYGSAGIGTPSHIAGELLNQAANIKLAHAPYRGSGPSLTDLAGGQIPVVLSSLVAAMPLIKAGKIRPLAVTSIKRWPGAESIPTVAEFNLAKFEHAFERFTKSLIEVHRMCNQRLVHKWFSQNIHSLGQELSL